MNIKLAIDLNHLANLLNLTLKNKVQKIIDHDEEESVANKEIPKRKKICILL